MLFLLYTQTRSSNFCYHFNSYYLSTYTHYPYRAYSHPGTSSRGSTLKIEYKLILNTTFTFPIYDSAAATLCVHWSTESMGSTWSPMQTSELFSTSWDTEHRRWVSSVDCWFRPQYFFKRTCMIFNFAMCTANICYLIVKVSTQVYFSPVP